LSDGRAEALLKSALEKIVYFEARSDQLQGDAATLRAESEQLRRELASATQREVELRRRIAELEVEIGRAHREREEAGRIVDAMRAERTALLEKVLEASRISGQTADGGPDFDLAAFIAQLRGEALALRGGSASVARQGSLLPAVGPLGRGSSPSPLSVPAVAVPRQPALPMAASAPGSSAARRESSFAFPAMVHPELGQLAASPPPASTPSSLEHPESPGGGKDQAPALMRSAALAVTREAERLSEEGRLRVPSSPRFGEESLFGFSVRELSSPDPAARCRAAERLRTLGDRAAAPAVATALHAERDDSVLVTLLDTFRALASREGAAVVAPLLGAASPVVRIAALRAVTMLDPDAGVAHLARAAHDPDPTVRRRASLLAVSLGPERVLELQREAAGDPDPEVRRLVVLATGAAGGDAARTRLLTALDDSDLGVRRAAARSLSRLLAVELGHVPELGDEERRREIRRLSTLDPAPLSVRAQAATDEAAFASVSSSVPSPNDGSSSESETPKDAGLVVTPEPDSPVPLEAAHPPAAPELEVDSPVRHGPEVHSDEALCQRIALELRAAMRGRTVPDLAAQLGVASEQVIEAAALLTARGQVVRRGGKLFVS
jgi:HEAT repeat protein